MRMDFSRKLPDPAETKEMVPLSEEVIAAVKRRTEELAAILLAAQCRTADRLSLLQE